MVDTVEQGNAAAARVRVEFETLAGRVPGDGSPPSLHKSGRTATWPTVLHGEHCDVAIDGWFVLDDRLLLGHDAAECAQVLHAIEQDLEAFLRRIDNGFFNLVVHDRRCRSTRFANDRFGGLPLYLRDEGAHALVHASTHAGLAELSAEPLEHDPVGLAELYWFGYQLGQRTAYRDVSRLPAASVLEVAWADGRRTLTAQPARAAAGPVPRFASPAAAADHLFETMRSVASSLHRNDATYAVKLSAGMDSRYIAAAWPGRDLHSYTFGHPAAREVVLAERLAAALGAKHRFVPLRDDLFSALHEPIFARHGIVEWFHQALVPSMLRDGVRLVLDGLAGDVIVGGLTLKRSQSAWRQALGLAPDTSGVPRGSEALARYLLGLVKVSDDGYRPLTQEAQRSLEAQWPAIEADMLHEVQRAERDGASLEQTCAAVLYANRTRRHVSLQGTVCRPMVETLYPFLDRRFVELMGCFPAEWVASKRLYLELFARHYPRVRSIPGTYSLLPFAASPAAHLAGRIVRYAMERAGMAITLHSGGRRNPWVADAMQWRRWLLHEPLLQRGARVHLLKCRGFVPQAHDRALHELARRPAFSGTRFMYTASYLLHQRDG